MSGSTSFDSTPHAVETALKHAEAVRLRVAGWSLERIAQQLGYADRSGARRAIDAALDRTLREPTDDLREIELQRCDELMRSWWHAATHGDAKAAAIVLRTMERRARLAGLDRLSVEDIEPWLREQMRREGLDPDVAVADADRLVRDHAKEWR